MGVYAIQFGSVFKTGGYDLSLRISDPAAAAKPLSIPLVATCHVNSIVAAAPLGAYPVKNASGKHSAAHPFSLAMDTDSLTVSKLSITAEPADA